MMEGRRDNRHIGSEHFGSVGYCVEGTAEQTLVLLHGLNGHSGTWTRTIDALKNEWTVIAPSLPPFFGDFADIPLAGYTATVEHILQQEHVSNAVLVGNSMGGWISMNCALRNPTLPRAIVLEDTAGAGYGNRFEDASPYAAVIRGLSIPVLIVWGEHDDVIPLSYGQRLNIELPRSILHVIAGAGHVPHRDAPEEFSALVLQFLAKLRSSAGRD